MTQHSSRTLKTLLQVATLALILPFVTPLAGCGGTSSSSGGGSTSAIYSASRASADGTRVGSIVGYGNVSGSITFDVPAGAKMLVVTTDRSGSSFAIGETVSFTFKNPSGETVALLINDEPDDSALVSLPNPEALGNDVFTRVADVFNFDFSATPTNQDLQEMVDYASTLQGDPLTPELRSLVEDFWDQLPDDSGKEGEGGDGGDTGGSVAIFAPQAGQWEFIASSTGGTPQFRLDAVVFPDPGIVAENVADMGQQVDIELALQGAPVGGRGVTWWVRQPIKSAFKWACNKGGIWLVAIVACTFGQLWLKALVIGFGWVAARLGCSAATNWLDQQMINRGH